MTSFALLHYIITTTTITAILNIRMSNQRIVLTSHQTRRLDYIALSKPHILNSIVALRHEYFNWMGDDLKYTSVMFIIIFMA